jgi:hypothetical protein
MSATQQSDRAAASTSTVADTTATTNTSIAATGSDESAPQRFRAATVEEALRRARELLGDDAEIIEANRIRRGGIGGFFATELGVEVLAQSAADTVSDRTTAAAEPVAPGSDTEHAALGRSARRGRVDATAAPATGPVTDYGSVPGRGRAAWRAASAETAPVQQAAPSPTTSSSMPSLFQEMLERAAADQLAATSAAELEADTAPARPSKIFRAWRVTDDDTAPTARPSMFDDEPLDGEPSGPVATPVDTAPADDVTVPTPASAPAPAAGGTAFAEHFLRELLDDAAVLRSDPARTRTTQPRRRPRSDAPTLPGIGEVSSPGDLAPAPAADAPAPTPRPKRASRRRAAAPVAAHAPELPLEPAPVAGPAAPEPPAGTAHAGALGAIVDQCLQLAAVAEGHAPRKVAVAVTMGDGQVVKITVEPSRSR